MRKPKLTPIEKRCKLLYASMKRRIEEKKDKNGRIIRHGRPIPFTYEELLEWIVNKFQRATKSQSLECATIQCRYCMTLIDCLTAAIDHAIPLRRGGSPGLDNLDPTCRDCNNYKGGLTPTEFIALRAWLAMALCDTAKADIEGRLKKAVQLAASVNWSRKQKAKKAT